MQEQSGYTDTRTEEEKERAKSIMASASDSTY